MKSARWSRGPIRCETCASPRKRSCRRPMSARSVFRSGSETQRGQENRFGSREGSGRPKKNAGHKARQLFDFATHRWRNHLPEGNSWSHQTSLGGGSDEADQQPVAYMQCTTCLCKMPVAQVCYAKNGDHAARCVIFASPDTAMWLKRRRSLPASKACLTRITGVA